MSLNCILSSALVAIARSNKEMAKVLVDIILETSLEAIRFLPASREYQWATFGVVPGEERFRRRADLEEYCVRETEGVIWISDDPRKACRSGR